MGRHILEGYVSGLVELHSAPSPFCRAISECPETSQVARSQATSPDGYVTNRRHEMIHPGDLERRVLRLADGTKDRDALLDTLMHLVESGDLLISGTGPSPGTAPEMRHQLATALDQTLASLVRNALVVR